MSVVPDIYRVTLIVRIRAGVRFFRSLEGIDIYTVKDVHGGMRSGGMTRSAGADGAFASPPVQLSDRFSRIETENRSAGCTLIEISNATPAESI